MARRRLWRNDVVRSYWRTRHPLLRFLCLHEAVTLPFVVAISDPTTTLAIIHLHFGDCLSGTLFSSRWSAMEFRRCQPPCARFIAREDPHSKCIKCLGFSHAREAVYGTSKCKICDDFRLITLRSRLEDYERESSIFPRRASSTSAALREAAASRRATSWGSDVELEEMESEQTGLAFSLPPSPERARANSPVEFLHDFLFPSPKAHDFVSFGLDDVLHTAASDSENFGPALADALPPSGQEARPSAAYSELVDVLSRATEKLALDWPDEPRESRASKLDERFLIGAHSKLERRKLPFFSDLHREISSSWKQPFSSHLTNAAAADFTNLVGSVEQGYTAMPVIEEFGLTSFTLFGSFLEVPPPPSFQAVLDHFRPYREVLHRGRSGRYGPSHNGHPSGLPGGRSEGNGRATDLALRATKHTARAVGRSMVASVAAERHLWLNLTEIREKENVFLMDAPISQSGLFGEAVSAVVDKFRSAKTQSAPPEGSPLAAEPRPRALPPLRFGEPVTGLLPANNHASGLTWSGPTSLPLRLIRVVPDLRVGMRRDVSPLWDEARPRKRFCPRRTRSPHLNLSQPPFEAWCADPVHPHFYSGWQLGDAFVFPPLQLVHSPPANRMLGDTAVSLLQCTEPVPATRQPSTSLSIIPSKDAEGSPSRWRVPLLPGLLDTPSQVSLPLHDTLIPLSHFLHEWERLPGVLLWVLRTI